MTLLLSTAQGAGSLPSLLEREERTASVTVWHATTQERLATEEKYAQEIKIVM